MLAVKAVKNLIEKCFFLMFFCSCVGTGGTMGLVLAWASKK